jgi:hypothetical protein
MALPSEKDVMAAWRVILKSELKDTPHSTVAGRTRRISNILVILLRLQRICGLGDAEISKLEKQL